jgi:hypothetical protein
MRTTWGKTPWEVKIGELNLKSPSAGRGSKLAFTCRCCERRFIQTTANHRAWATNSDGTALADEIASRWLAQSFPGRPGESDNKVRPILRYPSKPESLKWLPVSGDCATATPVFQRARPSSWRAAGGNREAFEEN